MQPAGFEDWKAVALESNPEIAAQRHAVEVAGEEINNRVPAHFPRIDLVRAITQDKSGSLVLVGIDALTGSIGVQANIPIHAGGVICGHGTGPHPIMKKQKLISTLPSTGHLLS
jgi:protease secretion system outer membrane protein